MCCLLDLSCVARNMEFRSFVFRGVPPRGASPNQRNVRQPWQRTMESMWCVTVQSKRSQRRLPWRALLVWCFVCGWWLCMVYGVCWVRI